MLKYLFYFVFPLFLFSACNKEEKVFATENMLDWFVIENKSGEVNQLIYNIYVNDDMPIFVNDTIHQGNDRVDHFGNPIQDLVLFEPGYHIFSTDIFVSIKLSSDSAAMLKAIHAIQEKVLPRLPKSGQYRPSSLLLVDSLSKGFNDLNTHVWGETAIYPESLKGITIGGLHKIPDMTDDELNIWACRILAGKSKSWIQVNYSKEMEDFAKITDENVFFGTNYDKNINRPPMEAPEQQGFFRWTSLLENGKFRSPSVDDDLLEYITYVYAYRGRENELKEKYKNDSKILRKFDMVKTFVDAFEEALKKNHQL